MASLLLIDDDENIRLIMAEVLRSAGHRVDTAASGRSGLAMYNAGLHDLVITDIVMPDVEGLELIGMLQKAAVIPRIIAISGGSRFSESVYLPAAKCMGVERTLAKPFMPDVLLRTVAEVLAMAPPGPRGRDSRGG